jgi:O-antigen/teichoic acid export membrane protein
MTDELEPVPPKEGALDSEMNRAIVRGSAWVGLGYGGGQVLSFASTLVLVRLLDPHAFGTVAVGLTLLAVVAQIQESGLGAALIHGRHAELETAASSVLVFAASAGLALAALTVAIAPLYTRLLHVPHSTHYVQALAAVLALRGLAVTPASILERDLDFRSVTLADLGGTVAQVAAAIASAAAGLGAWSLVIGAIAGGATQCAVLWRRVTWRPSPFAASRSALRGMLRYGRYVSGTNIMVVLNSNIDNATVARFAGAVPLGTYNVAWRLAGLPNTVIGVIIGRVMFSVYSRLQHDLAAVRAAYVQNLQRTMLLALPVTVALGIGARPIVLGLLGPKWAAAEGPLRVLAGYTAVRLLAAPSGELFKGIGRPHLTLLSSLSFFVVALPALLILVPRHHATGAALGMLTGVAVSGSVSVGITCRALGVRPLELLTALSRPIACTLLVALGLLVVVPATDGLQPLAELLVVALVATAVFAAAATLMARPLLLPIWAAIRKT